MAGEVPAAGALDLSKPAGLRSIKLGDNDIRELKTQFQQILDVDHDVPTTAYASDVGQHKKVTLQEQANLGTGVVGTTILGNQGGELVYTDEDDNDVQLTKAGVGYPSQSTVLADWSKIMELVYPVGSYYFNDSDDTNPGTLLGIGTWVAVEERVLVGYKSGSEEFGTPGGEYGAKTITLTAAQSGLPAHSHTIPTRNSNGYDGSAQFVQGSTDSGGGTTVATNAVSAANASEAHNNCQPSRTVYMWRRSA